MTEPIISPSFTVADIHKIREYNYERTKDLPREAVRKYYADGADAVRTGNDLPIRFPQSDTKKQGSVFKDKYDPW